MRCSLGPPTHDNLAPVVRNVAWWLPTLALMVGLPIHAAEGWSDALEARCWAQFVKARTASDRSDGTRSVGFANIRDGMNVYSPFRVEFAIRGMGVVPAGKPHAAAGHHHILIDTKLPVDVQASMPFNDKYVHFGKGQTFATLNLAPGRRTLRLLFADHEHRPYYIFSREVTVNVIGPRSSLLSTGSPRVTQARFDESCRAWFDNVTTEPTPAATPAYFQNVRSGDAVRSPFVLKFGAEGYGVCASDVDAEGTGHFQIEVLRRDRVERKVVLADGQTQYEFDLEPGGYEFRLTLVDRRGKVLGPPDLVSMKVIAAASGK
ncbi:MAG: DUF4399 domain-containing protein [Burkholderiales bacterium]|nr:DUF4399 domain-containing protein [Burkholderiales bacterium]